MNNTSFDTQDNLCTDTCWQSYKNFQNDKIVKYNTYDKSVQLLDCDNSIARIPSFMYDHPNLRGRPGYGLADPCLIDTYSDLIKNDTLMTKDRCKIQLTSRIFTGVPQLKGCDGDINKELSIMSGDETIANGNRKTLMEQQIKYPVPLVDTMKDIQNPDYIVPLWVNGGEDTRSYINRFNFNKNNL